MFSCIIGQKSLLLRYSRF